MLSFDDAQDVASRLRAELARAIIGPQSVVHEIAGGRIRRRAPCWRIEMIARLLGAIAVIIAVAAMIDPPLNSEI